MTAYLDTSAALRVLTLSTTPDAEIVAERTVRYLDRLADRGETIVSSVLLRTEILCQANRQPEIDRDAVAEFLPMVNLLEIDPGDLDVAPDLPGQLRTLDAIHLAVAVRVEAELMIAYDDELLRAARGLGLRTGPADAYQPS